MFDETPDKADSSANDIPITERTEDQWKNHFAGLFRNKLDSIFEIAKQIALFHDEVNNNPNRWTFNWRVVCKRVVGLDHTTCSQYETIHKVFSGLEGYEDILPPRSYTLYQIAKAFETHASTVSKALENGTISPAMTQDEARQLSFLADKNAKIPASSALWPDGEKPPREPRREASQSPPMSDEQRQEKKQKKSEEEARQEALALDEAFLSLPRIKADLKLEESEYCLRIAKSLAITTPEGLVSRRITTPL